MKTVLLLAGLFVGFVLAVAFSAYEMLRKMEYV